VRIATIDIGTNTTLLLIADTADGAVVAERAEITRLGRGIGADGGLGKTGIDRTLAVLTDYAALARQHGADLYAIATEGVRRASNAQDFLAPAAEALGRPVEVIDGDREAALTFLAARRSFPAATDGTAVVVDIGGGSTEIIVSRGGAVDFRRSLPLGSVRLTEKHVRNDPATAAEVDAITGEVSGLLSQVPFPAGPMTLIGIAGTVTTLAAMSLDMSSYDPAIVHGHRMTLPALDRQIARLRKAKQAERETMAGLDPKRADVILAGAVLLRCIAERAGATEVLVSDRGIRWGLFFERAAQPAG
jgi:exopolyphosphatase / guanosine-5'-triphosphate,3'-diphosphate pyrophosphatase